MEYIEVYVLAESRTVCKSQTFLDTFLPNRRPLADDFPFPQCSDRPELVYPTPESVIDRLVQETAVPYPLYWDSNGSGTADQGMLFFTGDAAMIVGLAVPYSDAAKALSDIAGVVGGRFGFICGETPPPETQDEFVCICRDSDFTSLIDGKIRPGLQI